MDASQFGVPQKRQRVIFLGTRDDVKNELRHPLPINKNLITTRMAIGDLENIPLNSSVEVYDKPPVSNFQLTSRKRSTPSSDGKPIKANKICNHQTSKHSALILERF